MPVRSGGFPFLCLCCPCSLLPFLFLRYAIVPIPKRCPAATSVAETKVDIQRGIVAACVFMQYPVECAHTVLRLCPCRCLCLYLLLTKFESNPITLESSGEPEGLKEGVQVVVVNLPAPLAKYNNTTGAGNARRCRHEPKPKACRTAPRFCHVIISVRDHPPWFLCDRTCPCVCMRSSPLRDMSLFPFLRASREGRAGCEVLH